MHCAIVIPPPRSHLVRWGGVLASNSPVRKQITLKPDIKKAFQFRETNEDSSHKNYSWSKMLAKVFKIEVTRCECGGELRKLGAICERDQIRRYLKHINTDPDPPPRSPARSEQGEFDFDCEPCQDENFDPPPSDDLPTIER